MPRVQNPSLGAGAAPLLFTTTLLSAAQILALSTTPVNVIPSPGAGNLIVVFNILSVMNPGSHAYVATGIDALVFKYGPSAGDAVCSSMPGLVTSAVPLFTERATATVDQNNILPGDDNQAVQISSQSSYNDGPIVTATLGAGGLGYVANDTGTITNGANDATYKVLTVGAGGAVLTFSITGAGTACTVANGNATVDGGAQPGVGVGFTVNITAVQTGNGTLKVVTYYQIIPVP